MRLDKQVDAGLSGLMETYIRQLFDDRNVSPANQKKLWEHYYNTLAQGVDLGYNPKPEMYDPQLAHSLKYDIAKFSAFKETSFRKQLEASLTKDGRIVPWNEFKKTADLISGDYNKRWLKTEYNHTVATANMAEKWQGFVADKDLYPNLRYVTAGDARVRDQHKVLDGTVLPIDHPFWKTHTAPLDWGCRCNIEQTDAMANKTIPEYKTKAEFMNNPYYSGKVFAEPAYKKELNADEIKANEKIAKENFDQKQNIQKSKAEYNAIDSKYKKEFFSDDNGGYLVIAKDRIKDSKVSKNETLKFLKEKGMATVFAKAGNKIKMLNEVPGIKSPDVLCNNILADLKQTLSHNNIMKYSIKAIKEQGAKMLLFEFTKDTEKIRDVIVKLKIKKIKALYYFTENKSLIYKTF